MNRLIILFFCVLIVNVSLAQDIKVVKELFLDAEEHLLYEEYDLALPKYLELIEEGWENANVYFSIGMCYINMPGQMEQAIPYLEKATLNVSANYKEGNYKEESAPEEAWFYLAKAYRVNNVLDKAIEAYGKYKSSLSASDVYYHEFCDLQIKTCETAKQFMQNPINFTQELVPFTEDGKNYQPAISGDGKFAAFTAYQEVKDPYTQEESFFEIVYYTKSDGHDWSKPKDITFDIESDGFISSLSMSYTGDKMLLYRDDYGNGNIYIAEKEGSRWGTAQKLGKNVNSRENETHASLSKDGSTLYFVSDRLGGLGGKDIYMALKDKKGRWGVPTNLGDVINTVFEEETPFLAEDGKTLYFASEAHNSMGGYDIFKSVRNESGEWSQPQNLGYPVNSTADDLFYLPIGDGTAAYMARLPEGGTETKIYRIEFPETERVIEVVADVVPDTTDDLVTDDSDTGTEPVATIDNPVVADAVVAPVVTTIIVPSEYELKGRLTLDDNKDINSTFYIHVSKNDGEVVAALSPDIGTGEFTTKIKHGSYKVKAFGDGYEPAEKMIYISEDQQTAEVLTFLSMVPKEVSTGEYYSIKSVLFDYNSATLNQEAQIEIEKLAQLMQKNSSLYIEVVGNSDSHGTDEYNKKLSAQRARSVVNYISKTGISADKFISKAAGKDNFIAINENPDGSDNPEGRKLNRRVDMKVVKSNDDKITIENIYVPDELLYKELLTYTIMLMESETVLKPSYFGQSGQSINNVWMFQSVGGYLYTVGQFKHKSDALELMNLVVDAGFPNAKIISSLEYNELVQKSSNFYKSKMSSTDKQIYTVQLFALKKELESNNYKGLQDVVSIKGEDGYYRYIYGEFIGRMSANQALQDAIEKGYYDAFIVEKSKFRQSPQ